MDSPNPTKFLYRTQWLRVGNNMDSRDNRFDYAYVTLPLKSIDFDQISLTWLKFWIVVTI